MEIVLAVLPYLIGLCLLAVVVTLFTGLTSMTKGGVFNARWGNTLMRYRVALQALTVALFLLYIILSRMQ
jgi:ABC-type antimicrobial peptide transport system permease subunit